MSFVCGHGRECLLFVGTGENVFPGVLRQSFAACADRRHHLPWHLYAASRHASQGQGAGWAPMVPFFWKANQDGRQDTHRYRPSGTRFHSPRSYPGLTPGAILCRRSAAGVCRISLHRPSPEICHRPQPEIPPSLRYCHGDRVILVSRILRGTKKRRSIREFRVTGVLRRA